MSTNQHENEHNEDSPAPATRTASVTLFKPSGKYYTQEAWRVPDGAHSPYQMASSPDFRRVAGGPVLVDADAAAEFPSAVNFGVPHLFPGTGASS